MKKIYAMLIVIFALNITVNAQEDSTLVKKPEVKKGWNFGVLPTITYNSDLGFQYGGLIDIYNYGDGELYPNYYENYYLEISRFTKGNGINNFSFESNRLFPGRTVFFNILYRTDRQYDFLGGNGYESVYNKNWEDLEDADYKSKMFYKNETNFFKVRADVLNPITDKWSWSVGFEYYKYSIKSLDVDKYNDGKDDDEKIPSIEDMPGLYDRYVKWGLIDSTIASGGSFGGLKVGLIYDTRNSISNATKGIWTELLFYYVPGFLSNPESSYLKFNFTHRQYFTLVKDRLSFAYRFSYAGNLFGKEPYFALANMYGVTLKGTPSNGLGGSKTIRGVRRNRVIGNGEALFNAEFRWKFYKFKMFKQNIYLGLTTFFDAGMVTQLLDMEKVVTNADITNKAKYGNYAADSVDEYFNFGAEKPHMSVGVGFQFVMNENFIVKVDYGKTLDAQDGPSGLYIGLNYLF